MPDFIKNYLSTLQPEKIPNELVVLLGIGIVFIGLICIVILVKVIGLFFKNKIDTKENVADAVAPVVAEPIQNRQEIIAAVSAVIAEELGTDISAIRIHSFKKI